MENNTRVGYVKPVGEQIVIPDECGDSVWDEVLGEEVKVCDTNINGKHAASLLNSINAAQECDARKAK
jgi:hypothetical protein